jgi:hypothetical protein
MERPSMRLTAYALEGIFLMSWEVEFTDEFGDWWTGLDAAGQDSIDVVFRILEERGPHLPFPFSSGVGTSRHSHMRELRVQHRGEPYRIFYAFDPRRIAVLLIGGRKTGNDRWYAEFIPRADDLYAAHLRQLDLEE